MPDEKYTVTIYVAAPGTPLQREGTGVTSGPGHMYYTTADGHSPVRSFGFAPEVHGSTNGPGKVEQGDVDNYKDPLYSRTLEVSKEQYEKLNAFGDAPEKFGFSTEYKDARNNCVDFTWAALNQAGINRESSLSVSTGLGLGPDVRIPLPGESHGKGALRPARNVDDVKHIEAPVPGSPLNREQSNPMPKDRTLLQHMLSDRSLAEPDHEGHSMYRQALSGVQSLNAKHGLEASERDHNFAGSLAVTARANGLQNIDHVVLSDDGNKAFAVEGKLSSVSGLDRRIAGVDTIQALETPLAQSSAGWSLASEKGNQISSEQLMQAQGVQAHHDVEMPSASRQIG